MDTQPSTQPQGYEPPLQQPVMQSEPPQPPHHDQLPPGTLTKHTSGFPAMLVGLAVGSLLVGGFMYVTLQASKSENAALKAELASKAKQSTKPASESSVLAMGTEAEQPGMDTTASAVTTGTLVQTTATNTNLVTYQDKNIPALKFQYDKTKWEVNRDTETLQGKTVDYGLLLKNKNGELKFTNLQFMGGAVTAVEIDSLDKKSFIEIAENIYRIHRKPDDGDYIYSVRNILVDKTKELENCPDNPYGEEACERLRSDRYILINPFYFFNTFKTNKPISEFYQNCSTSELNGIKKFECSDVGNKKVIDVRIAYTGSNPQEADEIVKQIKLD